MPVSLGYCSLSESSCWDSWNLGLRVSLFPASGVALSIFYWGRNGAEPIRQVKSGLALGKSCSSFLVSVMLFSPASVSSFSLSCSLDVTLTLSLHVCLEAQCLPLLPLTLHFSRKAPLFLADLESTPEAIPDFACSKDPLILPFAQKLDPPTFLLSSTQYTHCSQNPGWSYQMIEGRELGRFPGNY